MAQAKKRFRWRLLACSVLAGLLALAVGFIETVGQEGTLVGRYEQIKEGMSGSQMRAVLGPPLESAHGFVSPDFGIWREGPAEVVVVLVEEERLDAATTGPTLASKELHTKKGPFVLWRIRRWAEQAYTAIHGPRR